MQYIFGQPLIESDTNNFPRKSSKIKVPQKLIKMH